MSWQQSGRDGGKAEETARFMKRLVCKHDSQSSTPRAHVAKARQDGDGQVLDRVLKNDTQHLKETSSKQNKDSKWNCVGGMAPKTSVHIQLHRHVYPIT